MLMKDGRFTVSAPFTSASPSSLPPNVKLMPSHTSFASLATSLKEEVSAISGAYIENERANSYQHYVPQPYRPRKKKRGRKEHSEEEVRMDDK